MVCMYTYSDIFLVFVGVLQPTCIPGSLETNEDTIVAILSDYQLISVRLHA